MERFIQLNLHDEKENANAANLPKPEGKEPEAPVLSKRVNKFINKAAHKGQANTDEAVRPASSRNSADAGTSATRRKRSERHN